MECPEKGTAALKGIFQVNRCLRFFSNIAQYMKTLTNVTEGMRHVFQEGPHNSMLVQFLEASEAMF